MSTKNNKISIRVWQIAFFIIAGLLIFTVTTNYMKSDKIKYLNSQLSTAQSKASKTSRNTVSNNRGSDSSSNTSSLSVSSASPTLTVPSNQTPTSTAEQSWSCFSSVYTGFSSVNGVDLNLLCPSSSGDASELSCTGKISATLNDYADMSMTCND